MHVRFVIMSAELILKKLYDEHLEHFGEPDESIVFDAPPPPDDSFPSRMDVFIWRANEDCDVTTFATIGMASRPMHGAQHRVELHFGIRDSLSPAYEKKVAAFMANLALYPFFHQTRFGWWHRLREPGVIPMFPSCTSLFFHPRFVADGWDTVVFESTEIKLLNIIPITQAEYELGSGQKALEVMEENELDFLKPR